MLNANLTKHLLVLNRSEKPGRANFVLALYVFVLFSTHGTRFFTAATVLSVLAAAVTLPSLVPLKRSQLSPELFLSAALIVVAVFSGMHSPHDTSVAVEYLAKVLAMAAIVHMHTTSLGRAKRLLTAGFLGSLAIAVAGVVLGSSSVSEGGDRQLGVTESVNSYGYVLNGGFYCSFLLWFVAKKLRPVLFVSWFVFLAAIAGSGSRQVLVCVTASIAVYALLEWGGYALKNFKQAVAGAAVIGMSIIALYVLRDLPLIRRMGETSTDDGRVLVMADAWRLFIENPWWGVGPGAFRHYTPLVYTHTAFLELLATMGVFAFIAYYALIAVVSVRLLRLRRAYRTEHETRQFVTGLLSVLAGITLAGAFSLTHVSKTYTLLVAVVSGLTASWKYRHTFRRTAVSTHAADAKAYRFRLSGTHLPN